MSPARKFSHIVPPILLVAAVASYGALLYSEHQASLNASFTIAYVQQFGSAAERTRSMKDRAQGTLRLHAGARDTSARWHLGPLSTMIAPGTTIRHLEIFVANADVALRDSSGNVTVSLDGRRIGRLEARRTGNQRGFAGIANAPQYVAVPPGQTTGFRFPISSSDCVQKACSLELQVRRAYWTVRRVGLLFEARPPLGAALYARPASPLVLCYAIAAVGFSSLTIWLFGRTRQSA